MDDYSKNKNGDISFIQIGASDGMTWDPIREFIVRDKWSGILVEPHPLVFEKLKRNYDYLENSNLVFVNVAISEETVQSVDFHTFTRDFLAKFPAAEQITYLQKSSFDRSVIEKAVPPDETDAISTISVRAETLTGLLDSNWKWGPIDLLVIDAEGHEISVLASLNLDKYQPGLIYYESHHLDPAAAARLEDKLTQYGYCLTQMEGDTVARLGNPPPK